MKKKARSIIHKISIIILVICLAVLGMQLYKIFNTSQQIRYVQHVAGETAKKDDNFYPDWEALRKINPDIIGYLYYPKCNISYPIVRTDNNDYYLTHNFQKAKDEFGAIFMGYENNGDFSDRHSIIYGHSVFGWRGGMFTDLKRLTDKQFFEKNNKFIIFTPSKTYRCEVYAFEDTNYNKKTYQLSFMDSYDYLEWTQDIKDQSLYSNDDIHIGLHQNTVSLSTCATEDAKEKYIVHAVMKPDSKIKSKDVE